MSDSTAQRRGQHQYAWWIVLCLLGLDYFSSLAYLPSIALMQAEGLPVELRNTHLLVPLAALGVALLTLLVALPVYLYIAGRSPHGEGAIGLLERRWPGWRGKLLVLVLVGFIGTDYIMTRSLSTADAAEHLTANPLFRAQSEVWLRDPEAVRNALPAPLRGVFFEALSERLVVSVILAIVSFGFYFWLVRSLDRGFLGFAVAIVLLFLAVNLLVLVPTWQYLLQHPEILRDWQQSLPTLLGDIRSNAGGTLAFLGLIALVTFPPMAIGLSGFELALVSVPLVRGSASDTPEHPRGRIFNARLMMIAAAVLMSVLVLVSVSAVGLVVPLEGLKDSGGVVHHRAVSYLAHGSVLRSGLSAHDEIAPYFGTAFGTVYDLSAILILCLAGAAATVTLKDVVPGLLGKFGMEVTWTRRLGLITHLFNGLILVVTVVFRAKVEDLMWAYAASVLAVLWGASFGAAVDLRERARGWGMGWFAWVLASPFSLAALLFLVLLGMVALRGPAGLIIAGGFIVLVLLTGLLVRGWRGTDTRFEPFVFADPQSEDRFFKAVNHEYQVLIPDPIDQRTPLQVEQDVRQKAGLADNTPVIVLEIEMGHRGDLPGDQALLSMVERDGRETIRIRGSRSLPHTIASVALACSKVGRPPDVHFGSRRDGPLDATMNYLLLGQADLPQMVRDLLTQAEPNEARRPRVYEV
jgi:hypothetical protein